MRESFCRSCGAAIVWIRTPGGKSMPCNASPTYYIAKPKSGKQRIVTPNGDVVACEYTDEPGRATGTGFIPHWSTCPNANSHRKKER